jgi:hypothetical protein
MEVLMYAGYTETKEQVKARWKLMQRRAAKKAKRLDQKRNRGKK